MKKILILSATLFIYTITVAQNEVDALRYSQTTFGGTARYNAMGGAFGSVGGDLSVLSTNPAGIAIYRTSEFSFTPSFYYQATTTNHYNNTTDDNKYNFNFGNIGYVGTFLKKSENTDGWVSASIGLAHNRTNNFHSRISIEGVNPESSLLTSYANTLNKSGASSSSIGDDYPFDIFLAWWIYLVDADDSSGKYISAIPNANELQRKTIFTKGSMGETVFSFGGNYANKFYIGATIGVTNLKYTETSTHEERIANDDTTTSLKNFSFNESLKTTGNGLNAKIGMIYRVNDFLRLGGAIHTPTFYTLTDKWDSYMEANYYNDPLSPRDTTSPEGTFDYSLTTPFKAIGSMAIIFKKAGLISMDYEFVDYASARLNSYNKTSSNLVTPVYQNVFADENKNIRAKYHATHNLRFGTEWRYQAFSFRAGYALYGNPYQPSFNNDGTQTSYTFGIGVREKSYYMDFTYRITRSSENYYLYNPDLIEPTTLNRNSQNFMMTVGVRF